MGLSCSTRKPTGTASRCAIRPGRPVKNAYIESLNGEFCHECVNDYRFVSMVDTQIAIEAWRLDHNTVRPQCIGRSDASRRGLGGADAARPDRQTPGQTHITRVADPWGGSRL